MGLFKVKEIGSGEPKLRLDAALGVYLLGGTLRGTVFKWEFSLNIGKALMTTTGPFTTDSRDTR